MSKRAAEKIADKFARVISRNDDPQDVIDALYHCTAFVVAQLCPDCRKRIALSFGRQLGQDAESFAADAADLEPIYNDCPHPRGLH
jgi:hypothetical protein